jgi:Ca2+-binding EF-hand superfamily protein
MRSSIIGAALVALALPAGASAQWVAPMRFQGMDTNRDGVITREEWRGNARAFNNNDWNGDGILSGDEVRPGAQRPIGTSGRTIDGPVVINDWSLSHFRTLDQNGDRRLTRSEWPASPELFDRLDRNRNGSLNAAEYTGNQAGGGRERQFSELDTNRDGRIARGEWRGTNAVFDALDTNRDGLLTREEAIGTNAGPQDEFRSVDVNGDGVIARNEWSWNRAAFDRLDVNRDGRLTRPEWEHMAPQDASTQTPAYRAGYERGRQDGVQAGREDKPRGWDLDGQREMETADAGYYSTVGSRADYQAGYRAGFRLGYAEGFRR